MQGSHFSCFCIVCEATSPQTKASPQSLTVSHRVFTAMFVLRAAIVPSGETTQNKRGDISMTDHTTQIYGRQQFTNVPSFSSYKSVLKVCKQDTRPHSSSYAWIMSWFVGAVKNIFQNRRKTIRTRKCRKLCLV